MERRRARCPDPASWVFGARADAAAAAPGNAATPGFFGEAELARPWVRISSNDRSGRRK